MTTGGGRDEPQVTDVRERDTSSQPVARAGRPESAWSRVLAKVKRLRGPIVALAAVGAVLSGLAGYWNTYRTVREGVAPATVASGFRADAGPMSVAVLPIVVRGGNPSDERLAAVLTDDITTILSRDRWTRVVGRGRVTGHRDELTDPRRLGRELGARYLAMGEMHREGGKFAVLMHLVDTDIGADVWSDRFEFDAVQAESEPVRFAERVERRLWDGVLESAKVDASLHSMPGDAWNAYLRALANWGQTGDHFVARKQFGEVLRLDPAFVPALASESDAILSQLSTASEPGDARVRQDLEEIDQKTSRAVTLGTGDSYAWSVRADALTWLARWDEALAAIARARELDPGSVLRVLDQAWILMLMGRPDEALALAQHAFAMDPEMIGTDETLSLASVQCRCNLVLGRYLDATPACERLGASGKNWRRQATLAAVYAQQGEMSKAAIAKAAALKLEPRLTIAYMKGLPQRGSQAYLDLLDRHYYAGLRKAGFPEQ